MERVWDYFMRRKGLLGLILLISAVIGFASYCIYDQSHHIPDHTYITIANWGEDTQTATAYADDLPEVAIPLTGGESSEPFLSVMSPRDLVLLPEHHAEAIDIPALGEDATNANSSAPEATHKPHNLLRFISGFVILSFFSYLTYQHFRR